MHKLQKDVTAFHQLFGATVGTHPKIRRPKLRAKLIKEEAKETCKALEKGDIIEAIDGMCDLMYVTIGTAVEMGIDLEPFWDEVHRSNMLKFGGHSERDDGKIIRPKNHKPPEIAKILARQMEAR